MNGEYFTFRPFCLAAYGKYRLAVKAEQPHFDAKPVFAQDDKMGRIFYHTFVFLCAYGKYWLEVKAGQPYY